MSKMAGIVRRIVQTAKAPGAIGPYSQAVIADRTMYVSGQIGLDVNTGKLVEGGVVAETEQVMKNMGEILKAAGCDYNNVVKCTVLLEDINNFKAVNDIYVQYFAQHKPARAAYQVGALPAGAKVEIEAIAIVGEIVDASQ
ncbi:2-iminobutanoate/2-iminopropanoate deaminase [Mactra antiquata]